MGLTNGSMGTRALDQGLTVQRTAEYDKVIALAGNPNVGKSTVFNGLTGLHQHTGNWPGKTVTNAQGRCRSEKQGYILVDIPGTYSLMAHSAEEEVARNFICFGDPDAVVVVCDATCLERNLNLVLQTIETGRRVIVCVNLLDEAKRKGIELDLPLLSEQLGVPVIGIVARQKKDLKGLLDTLDHTLHTQQQVCCVPTYPVAVESAVSRLVPLLDNATNVPLNSRFIALKLLEQDDELTAEISRYIGNDLLRNEPIQKALQEALCDLQSAGLSPDMLKDQIVAVIVKTAEQICRGVVKRRRSECDAVDRRVDRILTGRRFGYPLMLALLAAVFWLTITGANIPSRWLSDALFWVEDRLSALFCLLGAPQWLHGAVVLGAYRVLAWVVSVMLPPMAIFFPLFTLLEDVGYLPRVAYNLDHVFSRCRACGKQALTMSMGFGCNAAGVVGARIIDSPRERLLAILTNNFVPCNGRFPTLIAVLTMFFIGTAGNALQSVFAAVLLTTVIVLGILITFGVTKLLSCTVLKGIPSSFTLEMPPYRKPQIGRVIARSLLDRTLFVLGRAAAVAAPAGLLIWVLANVTVGEVSILQHCATFLDPFAQLMGLDGVILIAFILGFPANEIVVPIMIMTYMAGGSLIELESYTAMRELFVSNGWTWQTAISMLLFTLWHWPCSTTLMTVKKETGSFKWTILAFVLPTAMGILSCMLFTAIAS
ncbi:MAG: ferrous iron transport protein B [Clostridia bacterium]|nr:ferrous iron transport protein B [Clostridia bacterium]